jgi:hypothetical protein
MDYATMLRSGVGARGRANPAPIPELTNAERLDRLKAVGLGAVDLFGIPSMVAGKMGGPELEEAMRGPQERNPGGATMGALLAGGPILGGVGKAGGAVLEAVRNSPKMAAALMAGLGITTPSAAGEEDEEASRLKGLFKSREEAEARRKMAEMEALAQKKTGMGPKYMQAQAKADEAKAEVAGLDRMIADENKKTDPEYIRQQEIADRQAEQDAKDAELDKPFSERHPYISTGMSLAGPVAAGALAKYGMGKIAKKGESLMADMLKAKEAGNVTDIADTAAAMKQWNKWAPVKQTGVLGASAAVPLELRAVGDNIDKYALPEKSKAQQAAAERLDDPWGYVKSSIPLIVSGAVGAGVGSKLAQSAPRGDVKAMIERYGNKDESAIADQMTKGSQLSTALQAPLGQFERARQARSGTVLADDMLQVGNDKAARQLKSLSGPQAAAAAPPSAPRAKGGDHPDHNWNAAAGRWQGTDGRFLPGKPPKD